MYHNTTESIQPELGKYQDKAKSQEERILRYMRKYPCSMSPTEVLLSVFGNSVPITSVRRALTNLTNSGDAVKTDKQIKGPYGRPEFQWKLADKYKQQEMF